jgi:hypothetical protein
LSRCSLRHRVAIPPHIAVRELEGEAVLLDLNTGTYFGLDPVGTRIWQLLGERGRIGSVRAALVDEYEVTRDGATNDLLRLVDELAAHGLVELLDE